MSNFCLCLLALTVSGVSVFAQEESAPQAQPAQANKGITLYVVANDKSGNPVAGLQAGDFTILDNKQPQRITSFQAAGGGSRPGESPELVLILDAVNTGFDKVAFARQQIDRFLQRDNGKLAHPVSIGIFTDAGLEMQPGPSLDGNEIAGYLDQRQTGLRSMNRSQGFYGAADRSQLSLGALRQIAQYEAKRPGRKLVVWISPGWALLTGPRIQLTGKQQQSIFDTAIGLSAELREAGVTLYMVDPLGTNDAGGLRTFYYEQFLKALTSPGQAQLGNLALQVFAVRSGGRVLNGSNDIAGEIEHCTRDANAYYILSFDPPPADGPNFYNKVEVKLNQGLKAQTLSGFYEQPGQK